MKREETIDLETPAHKCVLKVERRPLYFEQSRARGAEGPIFGWYHSTPAALQSDCAAVICGPIGHEYTRAHRTMRHLADRLAEQGIPALRFDYHGVGDSPGGELDADRVAYWQASIRAAIRQARALSGRERVCLIGVRLGGMLAALVAAETDVDLLVLWNVPAKGRAYVRELQAIAMASQRDAQDSERGLESAGFIMSPQTLDTLRKVDLTQCPTRASRRVLLVGRDDMAPDGALAQHLQSRQVPCDSIRVPGWLGMMADHQFTEVPEEALDAIATWVLAHVDTCMTAPPPAHECETRVNRFAHETSAGAQVQLQEDACVFGADQHLFGVLTDAGGPKDRPVVLLANAGAIHHVGPNRLYVSLARELATMGFPAFRFDLESLGDSVLRAPGRENYPYPDTATDDVRAAIHMLQARGYRRFILAGVCSGAHTAYRAGLDIEDATIEEMVLVNPWQFYWVEGMSLSDHPHFVEVAAYKKSMKDPARWKKLLKGQVNLLRLGRVGLTHVSATLRARAKSLAQVLGLAEEPRLSRDLRRVLRTRHIAMYFSEGEPGRDILMHDAKRAALRAMKAGRLELHQVHGADHTFSQWSARREITQRLLEHFGARYAVRGASHPTDKRTGQHAAPLKAAAEF